MAKSAKFVNTLTPIALAIALSACGGGSSGADFGSNTASTTTTTDDSSAIIANSIELSVSSRELPSDGSAPITITAIAKDINNNAIEDADIIFAVDQDATIIQDATVVTAADPNDPTSVITTVVTAGSIQTATLTPGSNKNQTLTVTVTSGESSESISVEVVGTSVSINGPTGITTGKAVPFVLTLNDSSQNPIAFEPVEITSSAGNTITTDSNFETNAEGEIAFMVTGVSSGIDTISANVLGVSFEKNVEVTGDEFVLSSATDDEIDINTNAVIDFVWNKDGVPQSGRTIILSATRGDIVNQTAVTDASGTASFIISSENAGKTVITATTADGLSTTLDREFIATTPEYLNTQADPTLIAPNGSSTIFAQVRDENDNPVKNKIIDFTLDDNVDGQLSSSTAVTDSLGRASVSYQAGNSSSAKDGVVIKTIIQGYPAVQEDEVFLTVGGNALRIVLGDDHLLEADDVFYVKQFGVIVTDSAGKPVADQAVSFKITPKNYYKGSLWDTGDGWTGTPVFDSTGTVIIDGVTASCISEDFDQDGNLDAGEDLNGNGTLEPTHDATVTGSGMTDEEGKIVVEVLYPKNTAWWSDQRIEATVAVDGTEFIEFTDFRLPALAADLVSDGTPPNRNSPYGTWGNCTDDPQGTPPPLPSAALTLLVVDAVTGDSVSQVVNDVWYQMSADGEVLPASEYTINSTEANIELGPNNSFRITDSNTATDSTGFHINVDVDGIEKIFFYRDDSAVETVVPTTPVSTDTTGPVIFVTGVSPISVTQGTPYVDAGATAVDDVDGAVAVNTVSGATIDTSILGAHTVVYRAVDAAGNVTTATRVVNVTP